MFVLVFSFSLYTVCSVCICYDFIIWLFSDCVYYDSTSHSTLTSSFFYLCVVCVVFVVVVLLLGCSIFVLSVLSVLRIIVMVSVMSMSAMWWF